MIRHTGGTDVGATSTRSSSASAAFTSASRTPMTPSCSPLGPMTRTSRARIFSFTRGSRSMLPLLPPFQRHAHTGMGRRLGPEKTQQGWPQPSPPEPLAPSLQTGATSCIGRCEADGFYLGRSQPWQYSIGLLSAQHGSVTGLAHIFLQDLKRRLQRLDAQLAIADLTFFVVRLREPLENRLVVQLAIDLLVVADHQRPS